MNRGRVLSFLAGAALMGCIAATGGLPIPRVIHSDHGDIPITWAHRIKCGEVEARGCFDGNLRRVWIITGMSRDSTIQTIRHEQCHASLRDAGIRVDSVSHADSVYDDQGGPEDYVCDALAWAWLSEKKHGH